MYPDFWGFHPDAPVHQRLDTSPLIDSKHAYRTRSLFKEAWQNYRKADRASGWEPLYTLKDVHQSKEGLPSAYRIYMNSADEYEAALKIVGSIVHWDELLKCSWFMDKTRWGRGLHQWRQDMARRNASLAMRSLVALAKNGDGAAARKLLDLAEKEQGAMPKSPGRPSSKKDKEKQEQAQREADEEEEISRMHKALKNGD